MVRTTTREELKGWMDRYEDFVLVDVRSLEDYECGHIPGAINIPLEEIHKRAEKLLSRRDRVVVYSTNSRSTRSSKAAKELAGLGFKVWDYEGGLDDWKEGGYPLIPSGKAYAVGV